MKHRKFQYQNPASALAFFIVCGLLAATCTTSKKHPKFQNYSRPCDVNLGEYRLKQPSVLVMPYENKSAAVFTDSLGNLDTFTISSVHKRRRNWTQAVYNGFQQGDTTFYCYIRQYYKFILISRQSKLRFILDVAAMPLCLDEQRVCTDAAAKKAVEVLDIWCVDSVADSLLRYEVFHQLSGAERYTSTRGEQEIFPEIVFFGRQFWEVETTVFPNTNSPKPIPESQLFYNAREGIVGFSVNHGPFKRLFALY